MADKLTRLYRPLYERLAGPGKPRNSARNSLQQPARAPRPPWRHV